MKTFLLLGIGRISQAAVALISLRVMTTYLPKDQVGQFYLVMAIAGYFGLVFINPLGMYFNRHIHAFQKNQTLANFLKSMNVYFMAVAVLSVPIIYLLNVVFGVGSEMAFAQIAVLIFLTVYGSTWFQTLCPSLNMLDKRGHFIVINNATIIGSLLLSALAIFYYENSAYAWLLGSVLGQIAGAFVSYLYIKKFFLTPLASAAPSNALKPLLRPELRSFCFPVAIATLLLWLQTQSYRVVVENSLGAERLAGLGVALGIAASLCALIEAIVTQYFYPRYYSKISDATPAERAQAWESLFKNSSIIYIVAISTLIGCSRPVLNILVAEEYQGLALTLGIAAVSELFRILTNIVYAVSQSEMRTKASILPNGVGALLAVGGTLYVVLFATSHLEVYLPIALVLASMAALTVMYFRMRQLLELKISAAVLTKTVLFCLPLISAALFTPEIDSLATSIVACTLAGLYSLFVLWLFRREFSYSA